MSDYNFNHAIARRKETERKRKKMDRIVIGAVLVLAGGLFGYRQLADQGEQAKEPAPEQKVGLSVAQLGNLATAVAEVARSGDMAAAQVMMAIAQDQAEPCVIQGFSGGPQIEGQPELEDLSRPETQEWIREDAAKRGWTVGFGHSGPLWLVIAENCPAAPAD